MAVLTIGSKGEEVKLLQKALSEKTGTRLTYDGAFGQLTSRALIVYQRNEGIKTTGIYDEATKDALGPFINAKYIRLDDIDQVAMSIGVDSKILKSLAIKEARASGFNPSGRCLILYERHIFHRYAVRKFGTNQASIWSRQYPNICHSSWNQSAYYGGEREWDRLDLAKRLDPETALISCSWGMFQIMGFNFGLAGYHSVGEYVADMVKSEHYHLKALGNFVKNHKQLYAAVKTRNFEKIAYYYNGPAYKQNRYDTDLRKIYTSLA